MLILVAHGSRDARWRKSIHDLGEAVQARLPGKAVGVAFMQFDGPSLPDVVREAAEAGHTPLQLLPLFMASAGHVDKDIKPLVAELSGQHPDIEFQILTPVGEDNHFPALILDIVSGASATG